MKITLRSICALGLLTLPMFAQSQTTVPLTREQTHYFADFFEFIGSADVSTTRLHNNEAGLINGFGLNATEAALLDSLAQNYKTTMASLRQSEKAIVASRASQASQNASIAQIVSQRDQAVAGLAATLLAGLRSAVNSRIMADCQRVVDLRVSHGIH